MKINLNFYGVLVGVLGVGDQVSEILQKIDEDFGYFKTTTRSQNPGQIPNLVFRVGASSKLSHVKQTSPLLFKSRMCRVYGFGSLRSCDYGNNHWVLSKNSKSQRRLLIFGSETDLLYEILYTAMLSAVGESLDGLGYHRVHALAYTQRGETFLAPRKSGGGKSSAAAGMLNSSDEVNRCQIFSDEIPLVKNGVVYPFPIRIALRAPLARALGFDPAHLREFRRKCYESKVLIPIPNDRVAEASPLTALLHPLCKRRRVQSVLFVIGMSLGLGCPQMAEHMLRTTNFFSLIQIFLSRFFESVRVLQSAKTEYQNLNLTHGPQITLPSES